MSMLEAPPGVRPLIAPMRWLLYAASALVFLAGFQLTVFTEQRGTYFAWTNARPLPRASRADMDAHRGPRTRCRHARGRPGSLPCAGHREAGVALGADAVDITGHRSVAHRDRLRRVPREPRERFPPDPAAGRRLHRLRGLAIHRGCAVRRRRELERRVRMGLPGLPGEHPACGSLRLARPSNVKKSLRNDLGIDAIRDENRVNILKRGVNMLWPCAARSPSDCSS